uniref:Lipase domain-containing protein n=1 Tax=Stomoxys calcitrans TaxID=35570 RepID=A0A1I8PE41_STOCA
MNPLGVLCVVACVAAVALASPTQQISNLKPSEWLQPSELEQTPSLNEITFEKLENMPLGKGAKLMRKFYHLSQIDRSITPDFVPSPSNIPVYIFNHKGQKKVATLSNYVEEAKKIEDFGDEEVTIFITGLPESLETVKKVNTQMIKSYIQSMSQKSETMEKNQKYQKYANVEEDNDDNDDDDDDDDQSNNWDNEKSSGSYLIVIDLGNTITDMERYATLDVFSCGKMIATTLIKLTNECDVPLDVIHVIGQGLGGNVAGATGKVFYAITDHKLRRITALDPASQMAKHPNMLTALARGSADFVDAIHTSALGMGTTRRVGDVDFFPNGPCDGVNGSKNVIDAHMRATSFFAESVRPANHRNFPAIESISLKQYKSNDGYGKRTYMGIAAARDLSGDYILEVNDHSPFGQRTPAHKQNTYHGVHKTSYLQNDESY